MRGWKNATGSVSFMGMTILAPVVARRSEPNVSDDGLVARHGRKR